jgi:CheY-like chemotaxis protein
MMRRRLLVIDDASEIINKIANVAVGFRFVTRSVSDPLQALEVFLDFKPHITMIDMTMPECDGIDVLSHLLLCDAASAFAIMSDSLGGYRHLANDLMKFHRGKPVEALRKPFRRADLAEFFIRVTKAPGHPAVPREPSSPLIEVYREVYEIVENSRETSLFDREALGEPRWGETANMIEV